MEREESLQLARPPTVSTVPVPKLRHQPTKLAEQNQYSAFDANALAHDRLLYPVASFNQLGAPRWEGSSAQKWLSTDIDADKHVTMMPRELHGTREEYMIFELTVFRKHIRQEITTRKFLTYMAEKKEKKNQRSNRG
jgi:hypothetical protein